MDHQRDRKNSAFRKRPKLSDLAKLGQAEPHDIYVRAHTPAKPKKPWNRGWSPKWPSYCLVFDTETTVDPKQKLTIGCYRRCELDGDTYRCIEEGLFYADDLLRRDMKILESYVKDKGNAASVERLPARTSLRLMKRSAFIDQIFWRAMQRGELVVGFNLPFDLSRVAVRHAKGRKNSWSLALSKRKSRKTGELETNPERPRILVTSQNSKMAFIKLGSILHRDEWPFEGRFLDLRTLGWALRNESFSLNRACKAFGVKGKDKHKPSGRVTPKEIKYCRGDVGATARLLNAMKLEFARNPIGSYPDKVYSPASIAKAYLDAMNIRIPKTHFKLPNKTLGIAMQAYYGGRAECRIRKTKVPVIHTDFTSQYPTVNALLGNWDVLKAKSIRFGDYTRAAKGLVSKANLQTTFDREFWKKLSFFALVKPENDIFPIRTVYGEKTQNIGLNYLNSKRPVWYAGPDVMASKLSTGKVPKIIKAVRMAPKGTQSALQITNLGGLVAIDPEKDDFYRKVIEQRIAHKAENKPLADFLKVVANSGSYGLFVEVNTETNNKEKRVSYFSGEKSGRTPTNYVETPGAWYFPPHASLITAGGRLLLAMLEKSVQDLGGSYLFCDTDSMCIVGSKEQQLVPCVGGSFKLNNKDAVRALSLKQVEGIARRFNKLNPYDPKLVRDILKIEDVNHVDSDPKKPYRQLFGFAVSAKRYALIVEDGRNLSIEKASGHGLGYLFAPKERNPDDEGDDEPEETPEWIFEAWEFLLRKEFGHKQKKPSWLKLPAMMRMVMSSPNVLKGHRPEWLAPFNFFLFPILSGIEGYPRGYDKNNFQFITRPEFNRRKWNKLKGINLVDGRTFQISMVSDTNQMKVFPDSFQIILNQYLGKAEVKSLAPNGAPCDGNTRGLLRRSNIIARQVIPVGKETDRHWEQGEDPSMLDAKMQIYGRTRKLVVADKQERDEWRKIGFRKLMRATKLTQKAIDAILSGKGVRKQTLQIFLTGVANAINREILKS